MRTILPHPTGEVGLPLPGSKGSRGQNIYMYVRHGPCNLGRHPLPSLADNIRGRYILNIASSVPVLVVLLGVKTSIFLPLPCAHLASVCRGRQLLIPSLHDGSFVHPVFGRELALICCV